MKTFQSMVMAPENGHLDTLVGSNKIHHIFFFFFTKTVLESTWVGTCLLIRKRRSCHRWFRENMLFHHIFTFPFFTFYLIYTRQYEKVSLCQQCFQLRFAITISYRPFTLLVYILAVTSSVCLPHTIKL